MARNWEERYARADNLDFTPSPLLVEVAEWTLPGRALDLASGHGRNALYLAGLGWSVAAVDSSRAAIQILRERAAAARLAIDAHVADMESAVFAIEPSGYDLMCDFLYLQRSLFPQIREGVRPGGVFVAEIHLRDDAATDGPRSPAFVLEPGELRQEFSAWKILFYSEATSAHHNRATARIIARRA
ncbi:MAG TPA: methyltransferase domain-containing protein [Bryobacteraceae bacterium]|jgi:SAM-dependent methyltransferase|nr:methyltransferase domain-containing protein [Bryobacteraceae bacterium]